MAFSLLRVSAGEKKARKMGGRGKEEGKRNHLARGNGYAAFLLLPTFALRFVDSGSGLGVKSGSLAILLSSDRSFRIVGTMAHLWGCPSARFLR